MSRGTFILSFPLSHPAKKLLDRNPKTRLGGGPQDAAELHSHPFFATIDWRQLYARALDPPYKPNVESEHDTSNFDPQFTDAAVGVSSTDASGPLSDTLQRNFVGFTYTDEEQQLLDSVTSASETRDV